MNGVREIALSTLAANGGEMSTNAFAKALVCIDALGFGVEVMDVVSVLISEGKVELSDDVVRLKQKEQTMVYKVVYNACYGGFGLSTKAAERMSELGSEWAKASITDQRGCMGTHYDFGLVRHDPYLIQVVEEMGKEASGSCAKLKVYKLNGRSYRIDEYDGMETVVEPNEDEWTVIG